MTSWFARKRFFCGNGSWRRITTAAARCSRTAGERRRGADRRIRRHRARDRARHPGGAGGWLLLASAASWNAGDDLCGAAERVLRQAAGQTCDQLAAEHRRWWERFWSRTFVRLRSDDGVAEFMESVRTLQLYYLASTSRGTLPPKWNGSLFAVDGDARSWGSQFWVWTTEISYYPAHAADAGELSRPFFDMYVKQLPDACRAARQRWNAGGAFFWKRDRSMARWCCRRGRRASFRTCTWAGSPTPSCPPKRAPAASSSAACPRWRTNESRRTSTRDAIPTAATSPPRAARSRCTPGGATGFPVTPSGWPPMPTRCSGRRWSSTATWPGRTRMGSITCTASTSTRGTGA